MQVPSNGILDPPRDRHHNKGVLVRIVTLIHSAFLDAPGMYTESDDASRIIMLRESVMASDAGSVCGSQACSGAVVL